MPSQTKADASEISQAPKYGADNFPVLPAGERAFAGRSTMVDGFAVTYCSFQRQPLAALVKAIQLRAELRIVDRTGFTGEFDFKLAYSFELPGAAPAEPKVAPVPDVFTALQKQLGLVLKAKRLPFAVVVVDSLDLTPAENL